MPWMVNSRFLFLSSDGEPGRSVGALVGDVLVKKVSNMEYSKGERERRAAAMLRASSHAAASTGLAL